MPSTQPAATSLPVVSSAATTNSVASSSTVAVTSTASATTTTDAVTTTTTDSRPIDPQDQALALAATLQAADFGAPWTVYAEGGPAPFSTESCSYHPDGAVTLL
ncbi:MAG: hypothetical protein ABIZ69_01555, partial [Ilumatobacteraceae bacterium]